LNAITFDPSIISMFATIILGIVAAFIAWHQVATTKEQIRLELFEKRYHVYAATRHFLSAIQTKNRTDQDDFQWFMRETSPSVFLFPREINSYLKEITDQASNLLLFQRKQEAQGISQQVKCELIDSEHEVHRWLLEQLEASTKRFEPYLSFQEFRLARRRSTSISNSSR
jgi:hypothetical protein